MPTGYTYASYQAAVVTQIPSLVSDTNFTTMLPNSIDYAELCCYRDLDFLPLKGPVSFGSATIGTPELTWPSGLTVLEMLYQGANKIEITPASLSFIRSCYGLGATRGVPQYFAVQGNIGSGTALQVVLGPPPDATYAISGYGTVRPAPLSGTNTTTWLSQNVPDLFWAAAMIYWAGYNRNYGAMSDDPRQAISWESEYQRLLKSAGLEEARRKFESQGWQPFSPTPLAQPRT